MRTERRKKTDKKKKKQDFLLARDKWRYVSCTRTHADSEVALRAFKQSPLSWAQQPPTKGRQAPPLTVLTVAANAPRRRSCRAGAEGEGWVGTRAPVGCLRAPACRVGATGGVGLGVFSTQRGFRRRFTPVTSGLLSSQLRADQSPPHALSGAERRPVPGHRPLRTAGSRPGRPALGLPLHSCRSWAKATGCLAHHEPFLPVSASTPSLVEVEV